MNTLPPEPSAKDPISATLMKALMRYIRANTLLDGPGYKTKRGPNGTTLDIKTREAKPQVQVLPWSFSCTEDEVTGERTGGWKNCRLQVGLDCDFYSSCEQDEALNRIKGTKKTADGQYYVRINLSNGADPVAEIVAGVANRNSVADDLEEEGEEEGEEEKKLFDYEKGIVSIKIGTVSEGKLDEGTAIHMNPVVWRYL